MSMFRRNNVNVGGTGDRVMIFAHGFGCDQSVWRHVAPRFANEFATVLFDYVGSGYSDLSSYTSDRYQSLQDYARDLVELGALMQFEDAVLVGHSCGAMIGMLAANIAPQMFKCLVLLSPSPRYIDDVDYRGGFSEVEVATLLTA